MNPVAAYSIYLHGQLNQYCLHYLSCYSRRRLQDENKALVEFKATISTLTFVAVCVCFASL
jgi:hypothetical protein